MLKKYELFLQGSEKNIVEFMEGKSDYKMYPFNQV